MTNCLPLTHEDLRRYARHLVLPEFGETAQRKIMASSVLFIGAGGLGAASLSYLTASGIGHIGIVDDDKVELSNLGRQIIHETGDIGRAKVLSAADRMSELNPEVCITTHKIKLDTSNAEHLMKDYDLIIDGSDNFETRYVINDACLSLKKPWVYAAVRGWKGQITSFRPDITPSPCYRCYVPQAPHDRNDCAEGGVISPLVGIIGSMQALEALRILTGIGNTLHGTLQRYDGVSARWQHAHITLDPHCLSCIVSANTSYV